MNLDNLEGNVYNAAVYYLDIFPILAVIEDEAFANDFFVDPDDPDYAPDPDNGDDELPINVEEPIDPVLDLEEVLEDLNIEDDDNSTDHDSQTDEEALSEGDKNNDLSDVEDGLSELGDADSNKIEQNAPIHPEYEGGWNVAGPRPLCDLDLISNASDDDYTECIIVEYFDELEELCNDPRYVNLPIYGPSYVYFEPDNLGY